MASEIRNSLVSPLREELLSASFTHSRVCAECGNKFHKLNLLEQHLHREHQQTGKVEERFHCPEEQCKYHVSGGRYFNTWKSLRQHYVRIHGERQFQCPRCQQSFSLEAECSRHEKSCGETFRCSCEATFVSKAALQTHARRKSHATGFDSNGKAKKAPSKSSSTVDEAVQVSMDAPPASNIIFQVVSMKSERSPFPILPKLAPSRVSPPINDFLTEQQNAISHFLSAVPENHSDKTSKDTQTNKQPTITRGMQVTADLPLEFPISRSRVRLSSTAQTVDPFVVPERKRLRSDVASNTETGLESDAQLKLFPDQTTIQTQTTELWSDLDALFEDISTQTQTSFLARSNNELALSHMASMSATQSIETQTFDELFRCIETQTIDDIIAGDFHFIDTETQTPGTFNLLDAFPLTDVQTQTQVRLDLTRPADSRTTQTQTYVTLVNETDSSATQTPWD